MHPPLWQSVLGVMAGGALGALVRFAVTVTLGGRLLSTPLGGLPVATLLVNVAGSFLLAFFVTLAAGGKLSPFWLLVLGTGFMGSLTTFSTFELDAYGLFRSGRLILGLLYVSGTLILGYGALLLGVVLGASVTR